MPGGSHIDMVYVYVPAFLGALFREIWNTDRGFSSEKKPKFENWVYLEQILVKKHPICPNWVLFYRKWYTDGWLIRQKLGNGIQKVRFSKFGRRIHLQFWGEYPLRGLM